MPGPSSITSTSARPPGPRCSRRTKILIAALAGDFWIALARTFSRHWRRRAGSPATQIGPPCCTVSSIACCADCKAPMTSRTSAASSISSGSTRKMPRSMRETSRMSLTSSPRRLIERPRSSMSRSSSSRRSRSARTRSTCRRMPSGAR